MSAAASARQALADLARAYGVQLSYQTDRGSRKRASTDALVGVLRARGAPVETVADAPAALRERRARLARRALEPVIVAWDGKLPSVPIRVSRSTRLVRLTLETEDGDARTWHAPTRSGRLVARVADVLPPGRHHLHVEAGNERYAACILSAPQHASTLDGAPCGAFAPVYAMARRGACHGTYQDLHTLARALHREGATIVGTLPMLASFLDTPFDASPYAPASRLFWNELYVDAAALGAPPDARQQQAIAACTGTEALDYAAAAAVQRELLRPLADRALGEGGDSAARAFAARPDVAEYARFRAVCDKQRTGWQAWPDRLRNGRIQTGDFDPDAAHYHAFAQWAAEQQIGAIVRDRDAAALYLDMPLGVHPDSYDTWRYRPIFATSASAGAPPDVLFRGGQDWGFPPMDPDALRADGYAYLAATLQHQLRFARVLRLDHVMSLYRLYWIPAGMPATEGVYVRYPDEEMFALLTLESARHRAAIVGEDLGTVPSAVRRRMERHAIHRMFVVQYEVSADARTPVGTAPTRSAASLNTHDMPTFAGFWAGHDIADLRDLRLVDDAGERDARAGRARLRRTLARHLHLPDSAAQPDAPGAVFDALLADLAAGPAALAIVGLEDLWLEDQPQNVPGTGPEVRPNWRRRFRYPFPDVLRRDDVSTRLQAFTRARTQRAAQTTQEQE